MSKIWFKDFSLEDVKKIGRNTMLDHVGIELTEVGDDYLVGRMPVDQRTRQPFQFSMAPGIEKGDRLLLFGGGWRSATRDAAGQACGCRRRCRQGRGVRVQATALLVPLSAAARAGLVSSRLQIHLP